MDSGDGGLAAVAERHRAIRDAIFDGASHLIIATDAQGLIVDVNPAAERMLGYSRDELVGRATPAIFHDQREIADEAERLSAELGEPVPPGFEAFVAKARRGLRYEHEWTYVRKDGSRFPVLLAVSILRGRTGEPLGFVGVSTDLTERKALERTAIEARAEALGRKEAERANRAKSKFLAAASHDLRQPLQSALLFAAALGPHVAAERGRALVNNLEKSLDALRSLLDRLLDISKLDAGAVEPRLADVPMDALLEELNDAYAPRAAAKGLDLRIGRCGATVRSDPELLARILRNLIENALAYTMDGGVEVECATGAESLTITVRDSGIGIPEERLEEIFQEFTQLSNPERDRNQGLGLGLAIVRRLSRLLDHPVEVHSRFGCGSEFSVTVPLATAAARPGLAFPAPGGAEGTADGQGRLVMVVDDDSLVCAALAAMIRQWGYAVLDASSWEEADAKLRTLPRPPDAVIADYRLRNGATGVAVLRALQDLYDGPVRGILLTGETGSAPVAEAKAFGCTVLHKPVAPHLLREALSDLLPVEMA